MVNLTNAYDPDAEASSGFEPLPGGDYVARIIDARDDVVSKNRDCGNCLVFTWKVEGGAHDGRLFWQRVNLWFRGNNEAKVREIANAQFRQIRDATGVPMPKDTDELLERPCRVRLKVKKDEGYSPRNEVVAVNPLDGAPRATTQTAPQQPAANGNAAAAGKPANPFAKAAGR